MKKKDKALPGAQPELASEGRYLNPFTDFGFKKLFGSELSKDLLISFLNCILPDQQIATLAYLKTEHLGAGDLDRRVIFDLYCENGRGEKFIVELQKAKQSFFRDRALFYSTFPIQAQGQKGDWNFELKAVYTVAILDFCFEDEHARDTKVEVKLMETGKKTVFYDKLTFLYLQMPNFNKQEAELDSMEDKWLYVLKNLGRLNEKPARLREKVFEKVFRLAEVAKFTPVERTAYEDSLKYYRDLKNSLDTSFEEGKTEGVEIGLEIGLEKGQQIGLEKGQQIGMEIGKREKAIEIAQKCLLKGMDIAQAADLSGLGVDEIVAIVQALKAGEDWP